MDFDDQIVMLEEVAADQIEVEVETSDNYLLQDPLTDHDYYLTEARKPSLLPHNIKIRELKALYHCRRCGYATLKKNVMDEHSQTHEPKETPKAAPTKQYIPCPSCNVKKPPQKYEKCTKCSFFTKKKASLKIHMNIHREAKPYKCTLCSHRLESLKQLINHYEDVHRHFEKYKCDKCDFSTHVKKALTAHEAHGRAFNCDVCGLFTLGCADMVRHMRSHVVKLNSLNT